MSKIKHLIGAGRAIFASVFCLPAKALAAAGLSSSVLVAPAAFGGDNPMAYFRPEDADAYARCVNSITNMQQNGELYGMTWDIDADYHMDRVLRGNCTDAMSVNKWLCTHVLNNAPEPPIVGVSGCTAFTATNAVGDRLVGRNFDYKLPMTHVLLFVPKSETRKYSSVGTVDAGWMGYDIGGLDNGTNDLSYAALFPYFCMDGMNETGFSATILSLDGRLRPSTREKTWVTEQFEKNRQNIIPTLAIRYLLDNAGSTQEAVSLLETFNMFAAIGGHVDIVANYHILLCDKSDCTRVVEWMPPQKEGESWKFRVVEDAKAVSNFYLSDGYGHGSNRWEIARHALAQQNDHLEEADAMNLCRAIGQCKGAEQTSWTHWSVVYNLSKLSAEIATLGHYDEIFPYAFKGEDKNAWEPGAKKSAKLKVDTELPMYDQKSSTRKDVVYQHRSTSASMGLVTLPPKWSGSGVSAANRMGCTYDVSCSPIHVVCKYKSPCNTSAFYADMSSVAGTWPDTVVAGVNEYGVAARVIRLRYTGKKGITTASHGLFSALSNCATSDATDAAAFLNNGCLPETSDAGVVFTDAKGNVAIWPAGAELLEDDASELFRNSLDLRKGIYEIDGDGRGEFDELPGLMKLASSADTKAIISMGYGHLDVMLPESNVIWRTALEGANIPVYGVIGEPAAVPHATAVVTYDGGNPVETNNQGRLVAPINAKLTVMYKADDGYYFQNMRKEFWSQEFRVGPTVTVPPKPDVNPSQLVSVEYVDEKGTVKQAKALVLSSTSQHVSMPVGHDEIFYIVTNEVVLSSGLEVRNASGTASLILGDGATLTVQGVDGWAGLFISADLRIYVQYEGTGRLFVTGGANAAGIQLNPNLSTPSFYFHGGNAAVVGDAGFAAVDGNFENLNAALTVRAGDDYLSQAVLGTNQAYDKKMLADKRYLTIAPEVPTVTVPVQHTTRKIYVDGVEAVQGMVWSNQTATVVYTADEGYMFASGETELTFALGTTKSPAEIIDWRHPGELVEAWVSERKLAVDTRARIVVNAPEQVLPIAYSPDCWGETNLFPSVKTWIMHEGGVAFAADVEKDGAFVWQPDDGAYGEYAAEMFNADAGGHPQDILQTGGIFYGADYQFVYNRNSYIEVRFNELDVDVLEIPTNVTSYTLLHLKATPRYNNLDRTEFARWRVYAYPKAYYWAYGEESLDLEANFGDLYAQETTFEMPFTNVFITCDYQWKSNYENRVSVEPGEWNEWMIYEGETYQQGIETESGSRVSFRESVNIGSTLHLAAGATLFWCFEDDYRPCFSNYDGYVVAELGAVRRVFYDAMLTNGVYTIATKATSAVGQAFLFEGLGLEPFVVTVGGAWVMVGAERYKLSLDADGNLLLTVEWGAIPFAFEQSGYEVVEGGAVVVRVCGGSMLNPVQTTLTYVKNTGSYTGAYVNGKRVSFPLTLSWAKGDLAPKEILFTTSASTKAEADKSFTLQLGAQVGEIASNIPASCTVMIKDAQGGAEAKPYVRALAWPANAGTVSGAGTLATEKAYRTLSASAKSYATFAGWYKAKADDPNAIDLAAPVEPYNPRYPRQIRVGYGTDNAAGTYFAYFTNVAAVAAVVEPTPFDPADQRLPGVAGVTDWDGDGTYYTMVGVKFALPVAFTAAEDTKGKLTVTKLPNGLTYNARKGCIEGVPTKAGLFLATFVASNVAGKHTVTYAFVVNEMSALAVGTFAGTVSDDAAGGPHRTGVGSVSFTAGKTGSLSAKVTRRLSGTRSFTVKGYDYLDEDTLGVAMTNVYGEVFEATLALTGGRYDATLRGTAFGGTWFGTLGYNDEEDGHFVAVRNAFTTSAGNADAQQVLAAFKGTYAETLYATNDVGEAEEEVGTVRYRVNAQGSVYVAAKLEATYDGEKRVSARTLYGTVSGAFVYDGATGQGGCGAALRSGAYLWSTEVLLDYATRGVQGAARYIRPSAEDTTEVVDEDEVVGAEEERNPLLVLPGACDTPDV